MPFKRAARENLLEMLKTFRLGVSLGPWRLTCQQSRGLGLPDVLCSGGEVRLSPASHGLGLLSTVCTF